MRRILPLVGLASVLVAPAFAQPSVVLVPPDPVEDGRFGKSVSSVPDTDGDGHEDLLIGAADDNVPGARKAYLFSGATGVLLHAFDPPDPTLRFGYPVSGVPDTDGDGRGDLLIGAIDETGPPISGRAYLYSGATGELLRTIEPPDPDYSNAAFGFAVAGVPDADGDGRGDVLVGSSRNQSESRFHVYLFSGATGALLYRIVDPSEKGSGFFGYINISAVADADGDGRGDLLLPDFSVDINAGKVYLFSGATGSLLHTLEPPAPQPGALFGAATSGLPDLNGDGRGEIFVGAFYEDEMLSNDGRGYVYSGATGALLFTLSSPTPEENGHFGRAGAGLPDVDGDSVPDFVVSAWSEGEPRGRVHLFSGASGTYLRSYSSPEAEGLSSAFGVAVAGVRDAEGSAKILAGAPRELDSSGRAYLITEVRATPIEPESAIPTALAVHPPYPNPFRGTTTLSLDIPEATYVRLMVYDVLGREVAVLIDGAVEAGQHNVSFDGSALPSGTYVVRVTAGTSVQTTRVTVLR